MDLMKLDLGCGANKQPGFTGMDIRPLPGVDIVHDLESFPWPIESDSCLTVVASHVLEHIKPWHSIALLDEVWRILINEGSFIASVPYPGSRGFWQDPTHINGWSEVTFQYFDPRYPLYKIYEPKPWIIQHGFPVWDPTGNLEVFMKTQKSVAGPTLEINVADSLAMQDKVGG